MKTLRNLASATLVLSVAVAAAASPAIEGVFGLAPVPDGAALAVWVPLEEGDTVDGVRWYHNDEQLAFPELLAVAGAASRPELIPQAVVVAEAVTGASSAWNEILFAQPLASVTEGLYLVFRLPEDGDLTELGQGGGAGVGYVVGSGDRRCWVTFEGEVWHPLAPDYQMAVSAIMGAAKSAGVLVLGHPGMAQPSGDHSETVAVPLVAQMLAAPNPFNPQTDIRFTLPQGGRVELAIYDIRGRLVKRLHGGELAAGEHTVSWDGRDRHGRTQPSGVYVARLQAGSLQLSSRLTLVQ
jgi:hypothetical protein